MYCTSCGTQIDEYANFCPSCGNAVSVPPAVQQNNVLPHMQQPQFPVNNPQHIPPFQQQINIIVPAPAPAGTDKKLRHGFTSFWLWLGFIQSIFGLLVVIIMWGVFEEFGVEELIQYIYPSLDSNQWLIWLMVIEAAILTGLWILIKLWRRMGFYCLVFAAAASIVLVVVYFPAAAISAIFSCSVYPVLTYIILRLRNGYNRKSTWEQLD